MNNDSTKGKSTAEMLQSEPLLCKKKKRKKSSRGNDVAVRRLRWREEKISASAGPNQLLSPFISFVVHLKPTYISS